MTKPFKHKKSTIFKLSMLWDWTCWTYWPKTWRNSQKPPWTIKNHNQAPVKHSLHIFPLLPSLFHQGILWLSASRSWKSCRLSLDYISPQSALTLTVMIFLNSLSLQASGGPGNAIQPSLLFIWDQARSPSQCKTLQNFDCAGIFVLAAFLSSVKKINLAWLFTNWSDSADFISLLFL